MIEAGFCKKPVIASKIDGIPEIINDGESGILLKPKREISIHNFPLKPDFVVEPTTKELIMPKEIEPQELATAIVNLIQNTQMMNTYGNNLYNAVKEKFSLTHYFNQLEEIYKSVFAHRM